MDLELVYREVRWNCHVLGVSGTTLTIQFMDHTLGRMPSSVLEFSLWDARCVQVPDMQLSTKNVELLRPWLEQQGCPWRIGWKRKGKAPKKTKPKDPRQGDLF